MRGFGSYFVYVRVSRPGRSAPRAAPATPSVRPYVSDHPGQRKLPDALTSCGRDAHPAAPEFGEDQFVLIHSLGILAAPPDAPIGRRAVKTFTVDGQFGGWERAQAVRCADGGALDQIYQAGR